MSIKLCYKLNKVQQKVDMYPNQTELQLIIRGLICMLYMLNLKFFVPSIYNSKHSTSPVKNVNKTNESSCNFFSDRFFYNVLEKEFTLW